MKKSISFIISVFLMVSLGLMGCSKGSESNTSQANQSAPTAASADSTKPAQGTLVVGRGGDSIALDPAIVDDTESLKVTIQIFDTLLSFKEGTAEIQPSLAEKYNISDDGLKYTFSLRKGVKFHDGTDFNAEAVVFNFNRWNDPKSPYKFEGDAYSYFDSLFGGAITEIKAVDDYTVQFTLNKPLAPFLENLALPGFGIASPTALKEKKEKFKEQPVGTGPFVFKEWKRNDSITLTKNENYWRQGFPKLNEVIFRAIPENSTRFNALQTGELDLMEDINSDDVPKVESNPDLQKFTRPVFNIGYIGFNTKKKPFDNVKVRQALNHAVNKQALITAFFNGFAEPAKNPIPPLSWGYNNEIQDYDYDLAKAKALLAEAGYPNGIQQELSLYALPIARPYMPDGKKVAEALQSEFEKIGVKVKIESPEWAVYKQDTLKGEKDDLFMYGWLGDNGDPDNFLYPLLDKEGYSNRAFYNNEEVHSLLTQARVEINKSKRVEMYKKAQKIIKDDAPWVPLVHTKPVLVGKSSLKGYVPSPVYEAYTNIYFE